MEDQKIAAVLSLLAAQDWELPVVSHLAESAPDPFLILISTLLSLRTKDEVTAAASERLFARAATPRQMLDISPEEIAGLIYPVGFFRVKARNIHNVCHDLIERFDSRVPDSLEELLSLKGVGRKTANLVVALGYNKEGLCVDVHVHRISNRLGYVRTKNPLETEYALREKLPKHFWPVYNTLMVAFGRNICRPVSPICSHCPVRHLCAQAGVTKNR